MPFRPIMILQGNEINSQNGLSDNIDFVFVFGEEDQLVLKIYIDKFSIQITNGLIDHLRGQDDFEKQKQIDVLIKYIKRKYINKGINVSFE